MATVRFGVGLVSLVLATTLTTSAVAVTVNIADYQANFQGGTPATGWGYLVNSGGAIGNSANYADLLWNGTTATYNIDGGDPFPRPGDNYTQFSAGGNGHPGPGTGNGQSQDRYVIAAYTVQASDVAGYIPGSIFQLTSSSINDNDTNGGNLSLEVYVNNSLIGAPVVLPGNTASITTFVQNLGSLFAGDTIYVAVGPSGDHSSDGFGAFGFAIQFDGEQNPVPEPSTALLLGLGVMSMTYWRRKKLRS